ncbi:MAG: hypothetical protein HZA16_02570 [Nitrospirae bacterium]|nr:hypothetical protein [Nitrospirota bacterium]
MLNIFKRFRKSDKTKSKGNLRASLKERYIVFQKLLAENNAVLSLMADMEEKSSGEYLFDRHYLNTNVGLLSDKVLNIIECLNILSHNRFGSLLGKHENIKSEIELTLAHKIEIPVSDITIPVENLTKEMMNIAGGKMAHLGEIRSRLALLTPEGFSISAYAYRKFMDHNRLADKINERLSVLKADNMEDIDLASGEIRELAINAELPDDLRTAIETAVERLKIEQLKNPPLSPSVKGGIPESHPLTEGVEGEFKVSVRSSAIHEDGAFSFAGQYSTFLNVPLNSVLRKYKEVVASLFNPRAIFYYKTKGFCDDDMVMSVGVLKMITAKAGGVMYSREPNDPEKKTTVINAIWGLGNLVVDGTETPNLYIVSRETGSISEKRVPVQQRMCICNTDGDITDVAVPDNLRGIQCLTDEQIIMLSGYSEILEAHYGSPQDTEWALDDNDRIYILQSRQLRTFDVKSTAPVVPRRIEKYKILIDRGVVACKGIACGKAFVLKDDEGLKDFPEGSVLVAIHTAPKYVTVMDRASAIITDVGSATGHMASLSREYKVPTILDTGNATDIIRDGQEITVDAINCNVYEGKVEELINLRTDAQRSTFNDTHLFRLLEKVLKLIVPLNLIDPDKEGFAPENCRTFHDITRFAHEMAMAEIFKTGRGRDIDSFEDLMSAITFAESNDTSDIDEQAIVLRAGIPVEARLIDIGGGVKDFKKKAAPEDITSIPFSSFLKGMREMRWPGPPPVDARGFLGMAAQTAAMTEAQLLKMAEKSYAIVSLNYMTFSIRLGYHFSMVEAYAGENINDNYIKFFFKGGGAATDRKLRRVRLIKEILKAMNFRVDVKEDVVNAMLTKYNPSDIEDRLSVMGKLTAYTKQLDMVMYNDAVTDWYIEEFVRDHVEKALAH